MTPDCVQIKKKEWRNLTLPGKEVIEVISACKVTMTNQKLVDRENKRKSQNGSVVPQRPLDLAASESCIPSLWFGHTLESLGETHKVRIPASLWGHSWVPQWTKNLFHCPALSPDNSCQLIAGFCLAKITAVDEQIYTQTHTDTPPQCWCLIPSVALGHGNN